MASGAKGGVNPNVTPSGYGPADLRSAYKLTTTGSGSQTVAIVDAYDDPTAESDLGVYRAQYGLPACTTANGCFKKVNQNGVQRATRARTRGWAQEISLDLDMARAICPGCHILLVEATRASFANLGAAVEPGGDHGRQGDQQQLRRRRRFRRRRYGSHYNHPGIAVTVSSGDNGYGVEYPAASQYVTAVGGTTSCDAAPRLDRDRWSRRRQRLLAYNTKPALADDTGLRRRADRRRLGGRRPGHRRRRLRLHGVPGPLRLARVRRNQRRRRRSSRRCTRWRATPRR